MNKNTTNQDKYPGLDGIESEQGFRRALLKQLERMENTNIALLEVLVEGAPKNKQKDIKYKIKDILDDGKLNGSVSED